MKYYHTIYLNFIKKYNAKHVRKGDSETLSRHAQDSNFSKPFDSQDLISNSPYCLPYSSCDVNLENLSLDQFVIPWLIFFFILITCLLDIVLIL